jgi:hypothetical protein
MVIDQQVRGTRFYINDKKNVMIQYQIVNVDPKPTPVENPSTPEIEPTVPPTTGVPPIR